MYNICLLTIMFMFSQMEFIMRTKVIACVSVSDLMMILK